MENNKLDRNLLNAVMQGFKKQGFVPMPGGQAEPVAGASPATAALAGPMQAPPGTAGGGGQMDPNAGMPIDPNSGLPIDPGTGLPIDPNMAAMGGMPMDPAAMGGMPADPAAAGGAPQQGGEGQGATVSLQIDDLKKVVEAAVSDALRESLPKEIASIVKEVSKNKAEEAKAERPPAEPKQAEPAPAPAPPPAPEMQAPMSDGNAELLAQLQRNNELLASLIDMGA